MQAKTAYGGNVSAIIHIEGLTKKFGTVTALSNVDLQIEEGELFGLLGPNGAGKTTLLSILSTMNSPTSGSAVVCGHDVEREQQAVRQCIGIVFQDPSLDEELTGEENLDFHGRLYGLEAGLRVSRIEEVLDLVDLQDRKRDLAKTYSGGMRRRLEIARGLMHRPRILFLDEPTLGLDPQTRRKIWEYIQGLKESYGTTIILTTHYMDEADQLCSRIAIIDQGEIVALDTPQALKGSLGGDLLELNTTGDVRAFIAALENSGDVVQITAEDNGMVHLTVPSGESFIPRCFESAQSFGVSILSVALRKPNLEDVFIKLTGHDIRQETSEGKERLRLVLRARRR